MFDQINQKYVYTAIVNQILGAFYLDIWVNLYTTNKNYTFIVYPWFL